MTFLFLSLARNLQKHLTLVALLESLVSGRRLSEVRSDDLSYAVRVLYHSAGSALHMARNYPDSKPRGEPSLI